MASIRGERRPKRIAFLVRDPLSIAAAIIRQLACQRVLLKVSYQEEKVTASVALI